MRVIGLMSGTSFDAVDIANIDFQYDSGVLVGRILWTGELPMPREGARRIRELLPPREVTLQQLVETDAFLGHLFADAASEALVHGEADAVCSHGQTVFHWVETGRARGTLQIGNPAWIAERTGLPVVGDFRMRDIAAGGQGAPLVSMLDVLLLKGRSGHPAALNLGGIANVTVMGPDSDVRAWDIGPANALIDAVVAEDGLNEFGFDKDGSIAARGRIIPELLDFLLADSYYGRVPPKSTGKEVFHRKYVAKAVARMSCAVEPSDLIATLTALTAQTVADSILAAKVDYLAVSGGGARNPVLMQMLRERVPGVYVCLSDELGAPADDKEAILCALIGWCTLHNLPATLPGVTGATGPRVLGSLTPGAGPLIVYPAPGPVEQLRLI